jgi:hypothetical protein
MADNENNHRKREPESRGNTPLHEAAARGDRRGVETLLASGADIHARNARGETALHRCALRGNQETTRTLIAAGAQVNARTHQGDTPLHLAAWSGIRENIAALVRAGADRGARNHKNETPGEVAISRDHKDAMREGSKTAETDKKMGFIDWVRKDKPATQQQSVAKTPQQQKPERAKEMYTQEAANENINRKPVERMPDAARQEAIEAAHPSAKLMEKATSHHSQVHDTSAGQSDGREALMHNQSAKGKTQEAMSPTDGNKGRTKSQDRSRGRGIGR